MNQVDAEILGVGVAVFLVIAAALWKAASLRGDLFDKWNERLDLAEAGLAERATRELVELQQEITRVLGQPGAPFKPLYVIEDPALLEAGVASYQRVIRAIKLLKRRFKLLLRLGPMLFVLLFVLAASEATSAAYFASLHTVRNLGVIATVVALVTVAACLCIFFVYAYLQHQLSQAEIMSSGGP